MNQLKTDKSRYWIAANLRGREVFSETAFERYSYTLRNEESIAKRDWKRFSDVFIT